MRTWRDSLVTRGALALCVFSFLGVVLIGAVTFVVSGGLMERAGLSELVLASSARGDEVLRRIGSQESTVVLISEDPQVRRWGEIVVGSGAPQVDYEDAHARLSEYLANVVHLHPGLLSVSLLGASDGQIVVSTNADAEPALEAGAAFLAQPYRGPHVGQVRALPGTDRLVMAIAAPLEVDQAGTVGLVVAEFDASWMRAEPLSQPELGPGWVEYLVDGGRRIVSPDSSGEVIGPESWPFAAASRDASGQITAEVYRDRAGDLVLGAYQWLPGLEVGLVHQVDQRRAVLQPAARTSLFVAGTGLLVAILMILGLLRLGRPIAERLELLQSHISKAIQGDLEHIMPITGHDELSALGRAFNHLLGTMRDLYGELEGRAADRTESLRQRSLQLQATRRVSSAVSSITELPELLDTTVMLIADSLGFDHAGVFLLDELDRYVVLKAASSGAGQRVLARGYKVRLGQGLVGQAALTAQPQIAGDVGEDLTSPFRSELPMVRSEMALPLMARGAVIGVLDIQSGRAGAFGEQDADALRGMVDQIALAVANARLMQEHQEVLQELERRHGEKAIRSWSQRTELQPLAYRYTGMEFAPIEPAPEPVLHSRAVIVERQGDQRELHAPIVVRGQVLGSVVFRQPVEEASWSDEDVAFVESACSQIGQALENARLLDEAQVRADFELLSDGIRGRIRESATDVDRVLQTTLRELGGALGARGTVQLWAREQWRAGSQVADAGTTDITESVDAVL